MVDDLEMNVELAAEVGPTVEVRRVIVEDVAVKDLAVEVGPTVVVDVVE